jgi:hypothetical protein
VFAQTQELEKVFVPKGDYGIIEIYDNGISVIDYKLNNNTELCSGICSAKGDINLKEKGLLFSSIYFYNKDNGNRIKLKDYKVFYYNYTYYKNGSYNLVKNNYNYEVLDSGLYKFEIVGYRYDYQDYPIEWVINYKEMQLTEWATWHYSEQIIGNIDVATCNPTNFFNDTDLRGNGINFTRYNVTIQNVTIHPSCKPLKIYLMDDSGDVTQTPILTHAIMPSEYSQQEISLNFTFDINFSRTYHLLAGGSVYNGDYTIWYSNDYSPVGCLYGTNYPVSAYPYADIIGARQSFGGGWNVGGNSYCFTNITFSNTSLISNIPQLYIIKPINNTIYNSYLNNTAVFTCNATSEIGLRNITFYFDNILNATTTYNGNGTGTRLRVMYNISNGFHTWFCNATDTANNIGTTGLLNIYMNYTPLDLIEPNTTLLEPLNNSVNNFGSYSNILNFSCNARDDIGLNYVSLYIDDILNNSVYVSGLNSNVTFSVNNLINKTYLAKCRAFDSSLNSNYSANYTFSVNINLPEYKPLTQVTLFFYAFLIMIYFAILIYAEYSKGGIFSFFCFLYGMFLLWQLDVFSYNYFLFFILVLFNLFVLFRGFQNGNGGMFD